MVKPLGLGFRVFSANLLVYEYLGISGYVHFHIHQLYGVCSRLTPLYMFVIALYIPLIWCWYNGHI